MPSSFKVPKKTGQHVLETVQGLESEGVKPLVDHFEIKKIGKLGRIQISGQFR